MIWVCFPDFCNQLIFSLAEQLSHLKEHKSDKIRDIVNKYETNLPVLQKLITGYLNASFKQIMTNVTARDLAAEVLYLLRLLTFCNSNNKFHSHLVNLAFIKR